MSPRSHLSRAGIRMRSSKFKAHLLPLVPYLKVIREPPYSLRPSAPCHFIDEKCRMRGSDLPRITQGARDAATNAVSAKSRST